MLPFQFPLCFARDQSKIVLLLVVGGYEMVQHLSIGDIEFDEKIVPKSFCWSGHCKSIDDFKKGNFLSVDYNGHNILICADSNSVAIADYLGTYLDKSSRFDDTANFMNESMVYWCYLAWEYEVPFFAELPDWVKEGLYTVFLNQLIIHNKWIFLIDSDNFEGKSLPSDVQYRLDAICRRAILDELQNKFDEKEDFQSLEDLRPQNPDDWITATYEEFCRLKQVFGDAEELMAYCYAESGESIGFGCPVLYSNHTEWIYEGVADSLYENYEEFEKAIKIAAKAGIEVLKNSPDEELSSLAYRMTENTLGGITVVYEADGKKIDIKYDVDIPDLIYSNLSDYVETEIKNNRSRE